MKDSKKKNGGRIVWYLIAIGTIILLLLVLLSSILDIGERLRDLNVYVEWAFYALCILLVWFLIINPVRIILTSPSLSIATTLECDTPKAHRIYKHVTKNILKNNEVVLTDDEKNALESYKNYDELRSALSLCMNGTIKKEIRKIIVRNAKSVLLSTAISQNSKLDTFSVVSLNLKMIKEIVQVCGFRPDFKNLSRLTINVASTALIAEGLESLNLDDILPTSTLNALNNVPILKPLLSSITGGLANSLLTIRVGLVTRGFLFTDSATVTKNQIRLEAFKDAMTILPQVIGEVLIYFPNKVVQLFNKNKEINAATKNESEVPAT